MSESGFVWGAEDVDPLRTLGAEDWELWWDQQEQAALAQCLSGEDVGGLVKPDECAPDQRVLGSWVMDDLVGAVRGLEPVERAQEGTNEQNPEWAKERAKDHVFEAQKLLRFKQQFEEAGADEVVLSWFDQGGFDARMSEQLIAELAADGALQPVGIEKRNGAIARENEADLRMVVMEALRKGAYEVTTRLGVDNVIPMNLAPKPTKDPPWRLISNATEPNEFFPLWSVRYETLRTVPLVVRPGDWLFSIDLTDAYHQFALTVKSRRLFGHSIRLQQEDVQRLEGLSLLPEEFLWDRGASWVTVFLRPVGLPMGFRNSCAVWTKITRVLTSKWRREGRRLVHLLDDFLFAVDSSKSREEAQLEVMEVLDDMERLGLQINWGKSVLTVSKCLLFLGMLVDSLAYRFFVPAKKVEKLRALVEEMVRGGGDGRASGVVVEATFRLLAKAVGKVVSMQIAVPAVRMMTSELYSFIRPEGDWDKSVPLTQAVIDELVQVVGWIERFNVVGNPIRRFTGMEELRLTVDAGTGVGWRLDGKGVTAEVNPAARLVAKDWADGDQEKWQCWNELKALELAVEGECEALSGRMVLVRADAVTTVRYVNKGSGPSEFLTAVMKRIWHKCVRFAIALVAEHIQGVMMIGVGVDSMSRAGEFAVAPRMFRLLSKKPGFGVTRGFERYTVDLYASGKTAKCKVYAARGSPDGSIGDARTLRLSKEHNYWVCPPLPALPSAVMRVVEAGVRATVVVPDWPGQPWFTMLRQHATRWERLKWHEDSPVMLDLSDKRNHHVHAVDKWDFVAFVVGDSRREQLEVWSARKKKSCSAQKRRRRQLPELARRRSSRVRAKHADLGMSLVSRRPAQILSACDGIGVVSLCSQRLKLPVAVSAVEIDEPCRRLTTARFDFVRHEVFDVRELEEMPASWLMAFDLLVGGFPCQDVSSANRRRRGLQGSRTSLVYVLAKLAAMFRAAGKHFVFECTDFERILPGDFKEVSKMLEVRPVVLCASCVSAGYRRRAFWASFPIGVMTPVVIHPVDILLPGRWTSVEKLPTCMASGTRSWNTAEVVYDAATGGATLGPLKTVEMERQMGLDDDYTKLGGVTDEERHKQIGNAFHAAVMQHVLECWVKCVVVTRDFDSTLGFPGEGPLYGSDYDGLWRVGSSAQNVRAMRRAREESRLHRRSQPTGVGGQAVVRVRARGSGARWRDAMPEHGVALGAGGLSVAAALGGSEKWGETQRTLLRSRMRPGEVQQPEGMSFREFADAARRDLLLSARSDATWKQYRSWVDCFAAWLHRYGLTAAPHQDLWGEWVNILCDAVSVLGMSYSMGTLDVFVSAVSAYMQDNGMDSPYKCRVFKMTMEGLRRYLGLGKKKKPGVEPWHVAEIVRGECPQGLSLLQFLQAKLVLSWGWQLFSRAQDFVELQVCDVRRVKEGLEVTIRYAKNDPRGLTRSAVLEAAGGAECPVAIFDEHVAAMGWSEADCAHCTKVEGQPQRCEHCPDLCPAIYKHGGIQKKHISTATVTSRVRELFLGLAARGLMSLEEAKAFSSKSLRCGGVSAAAAEAVRDGVLQGHGGWLQRQSLRHYDLMRQSERTLVSRALMGAVQRL